MSVSVRRGLAAGLLGALGLFAALGARIAHAQNPAVTVQVDATQDVRPINPDIYGLNHADTATLEALQSPLNRFGGNRRSRHNWQQNVDSTASDFFFESFPFDPTPGDLADTFVSQTKAANAQPMVTVPMIDFIAKTNAQRDVLCSFSIAKYGPQTGNDAEFHPDCGNGVVQAGPPPVFVVGNDPLDANVPNSPAFQQGFVQHLVGRFGTAAGGGVRYYVLDNEYAIWHQTHRDVHPTGATYDEVLQKMIDYAGAIKAVDPGALVVGPEEFGWTGYFFSGFEIQTCDAREALGDFTCYPNPPERAAHGGLPYVPYLLEQLRLREQLSGQRLLDVFSLHYYPQAAGVFSDDVSAATQDLRSRSTRALWDPTYVDESYIGEPVRLIPRMKEFVATHYPDTPAAVTEYHFGAESHPNGATTQADVLGIFGREGLDMATLYTDDPLPLGSFVAKAFQIYRNYDGRQSAFGDVSVRATASHAAPVPLANHVGVYAALRTGDGALTLMVVSKYRSGDTPVQVNLANFAASGSAEVWRLSAANAGAIAQLPGLAFAGSGFSHTIPPQSVTLFVIPSQTAGARLTLQLNQNAFRTGQTMSLTATLTPGAGPVDAYVVVRLPDGRFLSLTGTGAVSGIVPLAAGITPVAFSGEILRYAFTGSEPAGAYTWFGGLTQAGTTNLVGTIAESLFTFNP